MKNLAILLSTILITATSYTQKDTLSFFFEFDDYKNPFSNGTFDSIIKNVAKSNISIFGYADYLGTKDYNQKLSEKRALKIKNLLIQKGIQENQILSCLGLGELPQSIRNKKGNKQHRRVDIIFSKPKKEVLIIEEPVKDTIINKIKDVIRLDQLKPGEQLIIDNLYFMGGLHFLERTSFEALDKLLLSMQTYKNVKVEIQGHICCEPEYGKDGLDRTLGTRNLSVERAKHIYQYLVKHGIDSTRMTYVGYANKFPLVQDINDPNNRRVEIKIIE